mmetsp:Transcript_725/g.1737  ORF Transcript_725/g.1737 Transcript_725/m.1737 type:complete len:485 (-) Transcript_725:164-1618(-)
MRVRSVLVVVVVAIDFVFVVPVWVDHGEGPPERNHNFGKNLAVHHAARRKRRRRNRNVAERSQLDGALEPSPIGVVLSEDLVYAGGVRISGTGPFGRFGFFFVFLVTERHQPVDSSGVFRFRFRVRFRSGYHLKGGSASDGAEVRVFPNGTGKPVVLGRVFRNDGPVLNAHRQALVVIVLAAVAAASRSLRRRPGPPQDLVKRRVLPRRNLSGFSPVPPVVSHQKIGPLLSGPPKETIRDAIAVSPRMAPAYPRKRPLESLHQCVGAPGRTIQGHGELVGSRGEVQPRLAIAFAFDRFRDNAPFPARDGSHQPPRPDQFLEDGLDRCRLLGGSQPSGRTDRQRESLGEAGKWVGTAAAVAATVCRLGVPSAQQGNAVEAIGKVRESATGAVAGNTHLHPGNLAGVKAAEALRIIRERRRRRRRRRRRQQLRQADVNVRKGMDPGIVPPLCQRFQSDRFGTGCGRRRRRPDQEPLFERIGQLWWC